jgi:alpha-tubulin suppressor-like RCC1 family protein
MMISRTFAMTAVIAASVLLGSCDDTSAPAPPQPANEAEVSDPIEVSIPVVTGGTQFANLSTSAPTQIVYVSLPAGSEPNGVSAAIRRVGHPTSVSVRVVEGGFDPVPLAVAVDDSVSVVVNGADGSIVLEYVTSVKPRRPPKIVRTSPPRQKSDVPLNAVIVIVFTEPIDPASIGSTVRLLSGSSAVAGTAHVIAENGTSVAFRPSAPLEPNTTYRVLVGGTLADLDGETLGHDAEFDFTTGTGSIGVATFIRVPADTVRIHTGVPGTPLTYQLTATVHDGVGNPLLDVPVAWSSSDSTGLTVSIAGLIRARKSGEYTVQASVGGIAAHVRVLVIGGTPVAATLTPSTSVVPSGDTTLLSATFRDAMGFVTPVSFTAASSNPAVARVESALNGAGIRVIGVTAGMAAIAAQHPLVNATASVTVLSDAARVVIAPDSLETVPEAVVALSAVTMDGNGQPVSGVNSFITWSSLDPDVVAVGSDGTITVLQVGTGRIVARMREARDTMIVTAILLPPFRSVYRGVDNTCALTTTGRAYCWGGNDVGQLGLGFKSVPGLTARINRPIAVSGNIQFASLSVSQTHMCGVSVGGTWYCWGANYFGQLGDGTLTDRVAPIPVTDAQGYTSIVAGPDASCALTSGGDVHCWGWTGLGRRTRHLVPGGHRYVSIVPSAPVQEIYEQGLTQPAFCGLTLSGAAYCWTLADRVYPAAEGLTFSALAASPMHACGLGANGKISCWGRAWEGQLGNGSTGAIPFEFVRTPVQVSGEHVFSAVAASQTTTCALTTDGDAYCWGEGGAGQLGSGGAGPELCGSEASPRECSKTPIPVSGGLKFKSLAGSHRLFCGLTPDGTVYCWGHGVLGSANATPSFVPVKVGGQP